MMKGSGLGRKLALLVLTLSFAAAAKGRLVVMLVVDQLRYQDVLWLSDAWGKDGFATLGQPSPMRYESAVTETAVDHAVLATGTYAELNGIVANWYVRADGKSHEAVEDPACPTWGAPSVGKSAAQLLMPTAGDALKLGTNGRSRVVSVGLKDRTALFVGGASADVAIWLDPDAGRMTSSTCYGPKPPEWLDAVNRAHPVAALKDWVWTPLDPQLVERYAPQAVTQGAVPKNEIGPTFPHRVGKGVVNKALVTAVRETPGGIDLELQAARAAVESLALGDRDGPDLLTVSLPAVDYAGHQFGTMSRERVDAVYRVHVGLSGFVGWLRQRLGPRVAFMLTADHGIVPIPTDIQRLRVANGGSINADELKAHVQRALERELGAHADGWVVSVDSNEIWLRTPFPPRAPEIAAAAVAQEPGVLSAYLPYVQTDLPPTVRHSVFRGRTGQVLFVLRPLWSLRASDEAAAHGTPWNDDSLVPLFLSAPGWRLRDQATFRATQFAPSLSALLGATPPSAAMDDAAVERQH